MHDYKPNASLQIYKQLPELVGNAKKVTERLYRREGLYMQQMHGQLYKSASRRRL